MVNQLPFKRTFVPQSFDPLFKVKGRVFSPFLSLLFFKQISEVLYNRKYQECR